MTLDKIEHDILAAERALHDDAFLRRIGRHRATLHDEVETYLRQINADLMVDKVVDQFPVIKILWHHKGGWLPRETTVTVP